MTTTQAGVVLRHIRGLRDAGTAHELSDRQLLEHFAARREEAAFEALLRRHGAMVQGVCRRVLGNPHDAEDAFQATFLILARRAREVGRRGSVGGWLYQVAYTTALKAKASAAARRRREQRPDARSAADPLAEVSGRELLTALDEELARLPEKYRAPLVLFYLEGLTRDEAARRLDASESTVKRRLEEGRERLRLRLERRGLALPAALLAAGVGGAAVSPSLAAATAGAALLAATGKSAALPPGVAALMTVAARGLAPGRRKAVADALLTLTFAAAAVGLLACRDLVAVADAPQAAESPAPGAEPGKGDSKEMTVTGRVLGPDGKPVVGAQVAVLALVQKVRRSGGVSWDRAVLGRGKSDDDGRFSLAVTRTSSARNRGVDVLASREGYGLGWHPFDPDAERPEVSVSLAREQVIRGQLLDLQGQPAARVKVRVANVRLLRTFRSFEELIDFRQETVGAMLRMRKADSLRSDTIDWDDAPENLPPWPAAVTTDEHGRFAVRGIGPGMSVQLHVVDDRFALQSISVPDTSKAEQVQDIRRTLDPARVLEGRVTYADTGKPAADVEVQGLGWASHGRTDREGRFRINSYRWPVGEGGEQAFLIAYSPPGTPYCSAQKSFRWPKGAVKHAADIALPRGILVRGSVTDEATGRPVAGALVMYLAQQDNPNLKPEDLGGNNFVNGRNMVRTAADGTFGLACLPGAGYLLVEGPDADYVLRENGGQDRLFRGKRGGYPWYSHGFAALDLKASSELIDVKITLRKGVTIQGEVVGPEGRAVEDLQVFCRLEGQALATHPVKVRGNRFELHGCDPGETLTVMFFDGTHDWGATARLSVKEVVGKPMKVQLAPCGSARTRFLDRSGQPLADWSPGLFLVLTPKQVGLRAGTFQVVSPLRKVGPHTDGDGYCTFDTLIPGATYEFGHAEITTTITAEAGKTVKLPDIVVRDP
jgi:RNA polymerase sigma factor (sigma-70 family)